MYWFLFVLTVSAAYRMEQLMRGLGQGGLGGMQVGPMFG